MVYVIIIGRPIWATLYFVHMAYFHGLMCHSLQVVDDVSSGALIIGVLIIIEMMTLFCSTAPGKPGSMHLTVLPDSRIFCLFSSSSFFLQQSNLKCVHYCWRRFKSGILNYLKWKHPKTPRRGAHFKRIKNAYHKMPFDTQVNDDDDYETPCSFVYLYCDWFYDP